MRVKHLDDLYSWEQIRKLQLVYDFNPHNGFVPIVLYSPGGAYTSHFGGKDDYYEWYGKRAPYCAKLLWERVRKELSEFEPEALACDVVEASECFNTIRFRDQAKARSYRDEFLRLLEVYANDGELKSAVGRAPARPYPWDVSKRYEEVIIPDEAQFKPFQSHNPKFDDSIPDYAESDAPGWDVIKGCFVDLTENELAYLNGEKILNREPTALDREMIEACHALDVSKVARLLDAGANANATSGDVCPDNPLTVTLEALYDHEDEATRMQSAFRIAELLLSHGGDIDFSPHLGATPLYQSVHLDASVARFLLEKGADPNTVSWIAIGEIPATPFDHVVDDIAANGEEPDLMAIRELLDSHGGKYFSELVPDFYKT